MTSDITEEAGTKWGFGWPQWVLVGPGTAWESLGGLERGLGGTRRGLDGTGRGLGAGRSF